MKRGKLSLLVASLIFSRICTTDPNFSPTIGTAESPPWRPSFSSCRSSRSIPCHGNEKLVAFPRAARRPFWNPAAQSNRFSLPALHSWSL
eukprot:1586923-Pyramimonas_sp.AAC.1